MLQWLDSVAGPGYVAAILWTFAALILLVVVLLVIKVVRNLTFGTFVAGGRNRKTRLAVMDATAVDSHRRLVLVRRDDIEHLILIGGPTDVVVERDIRLATPRRPALTGDGGQQQQQATAPRPRAPQPAPTTAPARQPAPPQPVTQPAAVARPRPAPAPAPRPAAPSQPTAKVMPLPSYGTTNGSARYAPPPANESIDDTLMHELEASLDEDAAPAKPAIKPAAKPSLDDEMTKLLGELGSHKR